MLRISLFILAERASRRKLGKGTRMYDVCSSYFPRVMLNTLGIRTEMLSRESDNQVQRYSGLVHGIAAMQPQTVRTPRAVMANHGTGFGKGERPQSASVLPEYL
jgi:hypothetical protein